MKNKILCFFLAISCVFIVAGCGKEPDLSIMPNDNPKEYSTQDSLSAQEYSQFICKEISLFANELTTRLSQIRILMQNQSKEVVQSELQALDSSTNKLKEIYDLVEGTRPAKTYTNERQNTLEVMKGAISHIKAYNGALKNNADIKEYKTLLESDFNLITNESNLYNQ